MCGHGIIAMTKLLVESGFPADSDAANNRAELRIDTPAGLVTAQAHFAQVSFFSLTRQRSTAAKTHQLSLGPTGRSHGGARKLRQRALVRL